MIVSAFFVLGLQGKENFLTFPWLVDSTASNNMIGNADALHDVHKIASRTLGSSFNNVFMSPKLSMNVISIGQLVDNNFEIYFDCNGCCAQDQMSGNMMAKGPNVGHLFPFQFSISSFDSFACITITNNSDVWHNKL